MKSIVLALFVLVGSQAAFAHGVTEGTYQGGLPWAYPADPQYNAPAYHDVQLCDVEVSRAGLFGQDINFSIKSSGQPDEVGNVTSLDVNRDEVNKALADTGHYQKSAGTSGKDLNTLQIDLVKSKSQTTWLIHASSETVLFYDVEWIGNCQISSNDPLHPPKFNMNVPDDQVPPLF